MPKVELTVEVEEPRMEDETEEEFKRRVLRFNTSTTGDIRAGEGTYLKEEDVTNVEIVEE